jgi:peroxiredoxin
MQFKILTVVLLALIFNACGSSSQKNESDAQAKDSPTEITQSQLSDLGINDNHVPEGIALGSSAPDVMLKMKNGEEVSLSSFYDKQTLVLIFYRGYWCPVCNRHLSSLAENSEALNKKGVAFLAISPESYENIEKTKEQTDLDITFISDSSATIMKAFDVAFQVTDDYHQKIEQNLNASIQETNANGEAVLPVPATFIIDRNGEVIYKQFDLDYKNRAGAEDILGAIAKL